MRRIVIALGLICAGLVAGMAQAADPGEVHYGTWGVDLAAMDPEVKPGDDFFRYVNGHWLATAEIPPDRSATGAFLDLRIRSEARMGEIVAELEARPYAGLSDEEKKLRDLYDAFVDRAQIDSRGLGPAQKDLDYIAGLKTLADVATAMGTRRLGLGGPFAVWIGIEDKHPDTYSIETTQSGLGLPNRDYYLRDDKAIVDTREAYKNYLASMLTLAGIADTAARADRIYALEAALAKVHWTNADRRDAIKTYNPMPFSELEGLAPGFPWKAYFAAADIPLTTPRGERQVTVHEKSAFPELAKIFADTPVEVWRDYLTARYLHGYAAYLPHEFDETDFAFYGTTLYGNPQQLERAKRAVHLLDGMLGEALGKLYVAKYFPPDAKAQADRLVQNLLRAYDADIRVLSWMTPETREKALDKLHKFTPHIGYPDKWRDYSALAISRDDLIGDIQAGSVFDWNRRLKRIDQPVDKSEWGMSPPTVNAYYTASMNAIFFPAAILQAPFFDPHADDAVNYGAIGAVIGHEISHGFDDQGSKYDGSGTLDNWWTDEDRKNFDAATKQLGTQYDSYEPQSGLHVNGAYTMGENIADLAGLTIAYKAYHLSLEGRPPQTLDGFTGDQRFYLSYAQVWRTKMRDGALRAQVL
ncbi:MAG: M13 family metallopeptidase, partial [Alphaproteobacteria bacterium]|nr:M13 family metallopeptidase [Alphaproteobacteria bacterium]